MIYIPKANVCAGQRVWRPSRTELAADAPAADLAHLAHFSLAQRLQNLPTLFLFAHRPPATTNERPLLRPNSAECT